MLIRNVTVSPSHERQINIYPDGGRGVGGKRILALP